MIDEAYYEFSGVTALTEIERVPNLFVCRTFSKVFGMAAMRLGCLFSHPANIAVSAQGAVAVQREFARRDGRAGRGARYGVHRELRRRSAGRARTALRRAGEARHRLRAQLGEFRARRISASAPSKSATACAARPSWCATAATKRPAASASPWARASRRAACWPRWKRSGIDESTADRIRHGRRPGGRHRKSTARPSRRP